jgi:hypothetical protein
MSIVKAIPFEMTFGVLKVPFGTTRLNIIKMIAKLVATNNTGIIHELKITGLLSEIIVYIKLHFLKLFSY